MSKKLIITEKPSVARQFAAALGVSGNNDGYIENGQWVITWCVGHLIGLSMPEKYDESLAKWTLETLPFLPSKYKYEVLAQTAKQFKIVKQLLNRSDIDTIYNAGDAGREGEYIQRLVYQAAGIQGKKKILRVWISSQTDAALINGIKDAKLASNYDGLATAAYERAIADFAVGINLSRALSCKFGRAFNATAGTTKYIPMAVGRVMTCVLGMIVDREREIRNFKPVDYYRIDADHGDWKSHWKAVEGSRYFEADSLYNETGFKLKPVAEALLKELMRDPKLKVEKAERTAEKNTAPALFSLSELQSECTKRFKISPSQTLEIAQSLYEKKLTTYPRTDACVLSSAVADVVEENIKGLKNTLGWKEVDFVLREGRYKTIKKLKRYVDDSKITDHYAIIPTGEGSKELTGCTDLERSVYELICRRFLAIFYPPAEYAKTEIVLIHSNGERFFTSEKILTAPGYKAVYGQSEKDGKDDKSDVKGNSSLATIKTGDIVKADFSLVTSTTHPPKRFVSGDMPNVMKAAGKLIDDEELREQLKGSGIGTEATRAETISKLEHNKYIDIEKKTQIITPTQLGEAMYDIVKETVPQLLSPKMTASWEKGLSQVEQGITTAVQYRTASEKFVRSAVETIKAKESPDVTYAAKERTVVGKCPRCGRDVVEGSKGFGCVGFRDEANKCSFVLWKTNGILATGKKEVTPTMAGKLLKGESVVVTGLKSAKTGKSYSARFTMEDTGDKVDLKMSFDDLPAPKKRAGTSGRKKAK